MLNVIKSKTANTFIKRIYSSDQILVWFNCNNKNWKIMAFRIGYSSSGSPCKTQKKYDEIKWNEMIQQIEHWKWNISMKHWEW